MQRKSCNHVAGGLLQISFSYGLVGNAEQCFARHMLLGLICMLSYLA